MVIHKDKKSAILICTSHILLSEQLSFHGNVFFVCRKETETENEREETDGQRFSKRKRKSNV